MGPIESRPHWRISIECTAGRRANGSNVQAMPTSPRLLAWLRKQLSSYELDLVAIFRKHGTSQSWPLWARDADDLEAKLVAGGHFVALPKEPAALANILEVSLIDFLLGAVRQTPGANAQRGTERGYPDLELSGRTFSGGFHAVDVKLARRNTAGTQTQSRITLYTGNTFFRYPSLRWPGTFRPFEDYASHLDVLGIYTLNEDSLGRISDLELIVQESWRIASKQRSSTTREYIGAVTNLDALRQGRGEFPDEAAFYRFWRAYRFRIGATVQQQLDKLLAAQKTP
jgi:hypothetical protein